MTQDILTVDGLKAYYQMNYFGVEREVRAVDGITMTVRKNEIYGIAGESSSGKTSFIKVLAAAIRPPMRVVDGSAKFNFKNGPIDVTTATPQQIESIRWRHLSYIMQGSMSTLNPVRRIGKTFEDFAKRPLAASGTPYRERVLGHLERLKLDPGCQRRQRRQHHPAGGLQRRQHPHGHYQRYRNYPGRRYV